MKLKLFLICMLTAIGNLYAQNPGNVTGKVVDKATKEPISYATIAIKEDNKVITGGITEDNGSFNITNLAPKNYTLEIQYMGYKTLTKTFSITADAKTAALGTIAFEPEAKQLEGVTVVAERSTIEQKIDRKVINVGRDLTTAGATASEIMSNIPSVNVDQDGKISLRGNENVRVLVDGKPTNMDASQLLKQIPSTSIKKIELITNPSAKYNPEGMSGIINIVLHKNSNDGFNANFNTGITFADVPKFNNTIDMNYRKGKVNFFGTYGNTLGDRLNKGEIKQFDDNSLQLFDIVNDNKTHMFKAGMDFYIDDKNTISAYTNQSFTSGLGNVNTDLYFPNSANNISQKDIYDTDNVNSAYNLAFKHLFAKEGHTLDIEANYNNTKNTQDASFNPVGGGLTPYGDHIKDTRNSTIINVDYVNPLDKKSTLEIGAEARLMRTDNDYLTSRFNTPNAKFNYDVDIYSFYTTFGQRFKKISYQLGARLESYKVQADYVQNNQNAPFKNDYITVYPSAYFTYTPTEKNQFQLSMSRRVDRPSVEQTKPIREFSTPRVTSIGNPELVPQFTNSIEVNYTRTLKKGTVTAGIYYRGISDEITRTFYPDPNADPETKKIIMSYTNFDKNNAYGFEVSANYKFTSWWDVQPSVDFSNIRQKGVVAIKNDVTGDFDYTLKQINAAAFNARLNNNFKATKSLRFSLFGFYRGPVDGVQANSKAMYKIDAGSRYSFWENKASLSLRFNDIFRTMKYGFESQNPYPGEGEFRWESQSLFVGFNYMFGGGKNRALQRKQREDNTKQAGGGLF